MAANVLNTSHAIKASIFVVRSFVKFRELLTTHKELARNLAELESRLQDHDEHIQIILEAIRQLMSPPERPRKKIGFEVREGRADYAKRTKGSRKKK